MSALAGVHRPRPLQWLLLKAGLRHALLFPLLSRLRALALINPQRLNLFILRLDTAQWSLAALACVLSGRSVVEARRLPLASGCGG